VARASSEAVEGRRWVRPVEPVPAGAEMEGRVGGRLGLRSGGVGGRDLGWVALVGGGFGRGCGFF